jgi:hypothetical protein
MYSITSSVKSNIAPTGSFSTFRLLASIVLFTPNAYLDLFLDIQSGATLEKEHEKFRRVVYSLGIMQSISSIIDAEVSCGYLKVQYIMQSPISVVS